jgi:hypothetical protein
MLAGSRFAGHCGRRSPPAGHAAGPWLGSGENVAAECSGACTVLGARFAEDPEQAMRPGLGTKWEPPALMMALGGCLLLTCARLHVRKHGSALVAGMCVHSWGRGVAGSNPAVPTQVKGWFCVGETGLATWMGAHVRSHPLQRPSSKVCPARAAALARVTGQ